MPLYDVLLMVKRGVGKRGTAELLKGVANRVLAKQGVVTGIRSYGRVHLAYDIKKRDGWHKEGMLVELTVMAASSLPQEVQYLNNEERLLRWMVIHNRGKAPLQEPIALR